MFKAEIRSTLNECEGGAVDGIAFRKELREVLLVASQLMRLTSQFRKYIKREQAIREKHDIPVFVSFRRRESQGKALQGEKKDLRPKIRAEIYCVSARIDRMDRSRSY